MNALAAAALATLLAGAEPAPRPDYRLVVRIDPGSGALEASADIRYPGSPVFTLSRDLRIRSVLADGRETHFTEGDPAADGSRQVRVDAVRPGRLRIVYGGRMLPGSYPGLASQVNGIGAGRVELAGYVSWYPRILGAGSFTFRLSLDLPDGYTAVTNGRLAHDERRAGGRVRTEWRADEPVSDLLLVAAPGLRKSAVTRDGVTVEMWSTRLPDAYVERMRDDVARSAGLLARMTGSPPPTTVVRVVYSPRPGWGYVRTPLIVVSEDNALATRSQPYGAARDLRYIAHEVAHYWWHLADTGTPEDWLNEGMAEYGALLVAEALAGRPFADTLLAENRERSATTATTLAILATPNASPDREVNRYARPLLMLSDARRRYGEDRMAEFVRALWARFSGGAPATTGTFLEVAGATLGAGARDSFQATLTRTDWAAAADDAPFSPADSVFLGSWTGTLTQNGSSSRVVLHLAVRGERLVATTDSPDQGVMGIVIPSVGIEGRSLHFGIGNFGISYRGVLDEASAAIRGEWKQGGSTFPLVLERAPAGP